MEFSRRTHLFQCYHRRNNVYALGGYICGWGVSCLVSRISEKVIFTQIELQFRSFFGAEDWKAGGGGVEKVGMLMYRRVG